MVTNSAISIKTRREKVMPTQQIDKAADTIRQLVVAMVEKAKSGHPGGAMGGADFLSVLYTEFLNFDPEDLTWPNRDRFFLDPGHMSPMLYATLALFNIFSVEDLMAFRQWESVTPGHPERNIKRGIENTSGPLGQGHAMALGAAIAERFLVARFGKWMAHKIYSYISDGGIQEEISQGVGRLAGHLGLSNLILFYDSNDIQLSTSTDAVTSEDTAAKYRAWGWSVVTIDGNDKSQIRNALGRARAEQEHPTLIIGKTVMGKGARTATGGSFEGKVSSHGMPLSEAGASVEMTLRNLGCDPADPFYIAPGMREFYQRVALTKHLFVKNKKNEQAAWETANPEKAAQLRCFLSGELPPIDWAAIRHKPGGATRAASSTVLAEFAKKIGNMIVASADLSNSDKTDGFLKQTTVLIRGDFSGAFLQAGVAELTMAAVMNGIAAHGGVIPVCGTFFTFSDYMKPAVRLAALMQLPVKYIFSHDAFRVGEDGPTHQPIEQEAQLRLLEKIKNLDGEHCMLVLRPADSNETTVAWKMAMETDKPCALILTRQNVPDLPALRGTSRFAEALAAEKGAYVVYETGDKPDVILVADGSEVGTLIEGAKRLHEEKKLALRVVSVPSEAVFREQPVGYQQSILPEFVPTFGLTAGLPDTLQRLVGPLGKAIGLERFGASAPYKVLDEKFGYTSAHVVKHVEAYLAEYRSTVKRIAALSQ
ncbi:MAG: transketolase [Chitinispirillaceae bacterium]|nr:transketolase [Chitinispirillaceae bacterium]